MFVNTTNVIALKSLGFHCTYILMLTDIVRLIYKVI